MKWKLILASSSPRRKQMFSWLHIPYQVIPSEVEEIVDESLAPSQVTTGLARDKALWVSEKAAPHSLIVGSDTIVIDSKLNILGKPANKAEAKEMLKNLAGTRHQVISGVSLIWKSELEVIEDNFFVESHVDFNEIDDKDLDIYLESGESLDKAGSYGIQGEALLHIARLEGSYSNVVGFPLSDFVSRLKQKARELDLDQWRDLF